MLTIFYDGQCPLCTKEMAALKLHDEAGNIQLEDIHQTHFSERFPEINFDQAMQILHGYYKGKIIYGLDVTCRAWRLVNKHRYLQMLRWPVIKPIADRCYLLFAKHRNRLSRLFVRSCDNNCKL